MNKSSDDWNKLKHLVDLSAENARLKAEVERLNAVIKSHKDAGIRIFAMMDEERRLTKHLKAEVERLKSLCDNLGMGGKHTITAIVEQNARLKAEVERLRKAGDAMLPFFVYPPYEKGSHNAVLNWNAAKEVKQP